MRRVSYIFLAMGAGVGITLLASCYKASERKTASAPETATNPIQQELPGENPAHPPSAGSMATSQDVNSVIEQLEKAWESVKSMRASYRSTFIRDGNMALENSGTLIYANDGNAGKYKYTGSSRGAIDGMGGREYKGTILFDGVLLHNVGEMLDGTKRAESMLPRLLPTVPPGGNALFDLLRRDYTLSVQSPSAGQDVTSATTILCRLQEGSSDTFRFPEMQITFDAIHGRVLEVEGKIMADGDHWKTEILQAEFNVELDISEFIFVCPPDAFLIESWKTPSQPSMAEMQPRKTEETLAAE